MAAPAASRCVSPKAAAQAIDDLNRCRGHREGANAWTRTEGS